MATSEQMEDLSNRIASLEKTIEVWASQRDQDDHKLEKMDKTITEIYSLLSGSLKDVGVLTIIRDHTKVIADLQSKVDSQQVIISTFQKEKEFYQKMLKVASIAVPVIWSVIYFLAKKAFAFIP